MKNATFLALDDTYRERDAAVAAGESWLLKQKASHQSWRQRMARKMVESGNRMETDPEYRRKIQSMTH